jgi:tetratricopeptide (TPR) repeat protein
MWKKNAAELYEKACYKLQKHEYDHALKMGKELIKLRHSGGFEIVARVHIHREKPEEAIATLKEGVSFAPQVWVLWSILGNVYSDEGNFSAANEAYDKALQCPNVEISTVEFNRALALGREGKHLEALAICQSDTITSETFAYRKQTLSANCLICLDRFDEAMETLSKVIEELEPSMTDTPPEIVDRDKQEELKYANLLLAKALLRGRSEREQARELVRSSMFSTFRNFEFALSLFREIIGQKSSHSKLHRIVASGKWNGDCRYGAKFYRPYQVIADSAADCLKYIVEYEPDDVVKASLKIEQSEALEDRPDEFQGVCWVSAYVTSSENEKEQKQKRWPL